jgi:hypothetical protein
MNSLAAQLTCLEITNLIRLAASQPEWEHLFRHTLVQETAYASLVLYRPARRRPGCDRRIGQADAVGGARFRKPASLYLRGQALREMGWAAEARGIVHAASLCISLSHSCSLLCPPSPTLPYSSPPA